MTKMRQWSILTAVAVIIVLAAGWFLMVKPQKTKAAGLRTQASTQQQQNQVLLSQIATLQAEEKSLPAQQAALRKFTTQVPNDAAEPTIIRQLSAAANGAGVDLVSMTPGTASPVAAPLAATGTGTAGTATSGAPVGGTSLTTPATGGTLEQLPISLGITGTYPNMESFFQALESLPRALLVTGWSLCPVGGSGSGGAGGATCTAPTPPGTATPAANMLGGTLSATIFYAPPASTVAATGTQSLTGTTAPSTTTTTTTATVPGTTPSTAATPATTGGAAPPAS